MLLWIAFAFLTAAVLAAVLAPLARPQRSEDVGASVEPSTLAVYRHQLAEVEAERERGLIGAGEAEAARLEISRRLLAAEGRFQHNETRAVVPRAFLRPRHASIALGTAIAVPVLTLGLYLFHGSPGAPSSPFATRTDATKDQAELAGLIAKVETRLRETPEDGRGWEVIAPVYLKLGRFRDAATAYANAARLQGESVNLLAGLAEATIFANDGIVTEQARTSYEKILKLEPGRVEARFWLAMAKEQDGRLTEALDDYKTLLKEAPPEAAYRPPLNLRVKEVSARLAAVLPADSAGPTTADIEGAAKLSPEQRAQMISGMVDGLAQRLKNNGKDLPGWLRLLNAYAVLGRTEDARKALAEARRNFDGDARALSDLSKLAVTLGLGS
jgi:cytochrome c-type biogenesis protein CcmH